MSDRFELLEEVGIGGMGTVWRARNRTTGEVVALKLLHRQFVGDPDYVTRLEREVETARRIDSPHVVKVQGYGRLDGVPYVAMEYVAGRSLREIVRESGPVGWDEAKRIGIQLATALAAAHAAGIIHRDVKPSNVLMDADGNAKLADFGIARANDLTRMTGSVTVLGTPAYMSPDGEASVQSDLYALGCVLYELMIGEPPFEGESQQQVLLKHIREAPRLERLPASGRRVVGWLLEKEPRRRPASAEALLAVLQGSSVRTGYQPRMGVTRWMTVGVLGMAGLVLVGGLALIRSFLLAEPDDGAARRGEYSDSASPPTEAPRVLSEGQVIAHPGDSCFSIADRLHVTVADLVAQNFGPDGCTSLRAGDELLVPSASRCSEFRSVPARSKSVATSCTVAAGDTVRVTSSGEWCLGIPAADERVCYSPDGAPPEPWDTDLAAPNARVGQLVGRIGDGPWLPIGIAATVIADRAGLLHLAVNDRVPYYDDNHGAIGVAISVTTGRTTTALSATSTQEATPTATQTPTPIPTRTATPVATTAPTATATQTPSPTPTLSPRVTQVVVFVPGTTPVWTDTGIDIRLGDFVEVFAHGNWAGGPAGPIDTAECIVKYPGFDKAPAGWVAPGLTPFCLVGRVGNGAPFDVSTLFRSTMQTSGRFFLALNDDLFSDNGGGVTAEITLSVMVP